MSNTNDNQFLNNFSTHKTFEETKYLSSPVGNRTPVSRLTGGDTHHYTIEDWAHMKFVGMEKSDMESFFFFRDCTENGQCGGRTHDIRVISTTL